jgi:hypothetical protein
VWKKTDKWKPGRLGTASAGFGVQDSDSGTTGFAKKQFAHREKLASDLAERIGVAVPKVVLDHVDGRADLHAISHAHGKESIDLTLLRDRLTDRFNSPEVKDAIKQASGLLPFHSWIATQDLKDEHLVVATDNAGAYTIAAIDFAYSLDLPPPDGGPVQPPAGPPTLAANVDKSIVEATVQKIESVADDEIRAIVQALPAELADDNEKVRLANGLIGRRAKIRAVMQNQGWMP